MSRVPRAVAPGERLRDQVYQRIREALSTGQIEPGQRMPEIALAERYGVSRTPIREALFQLQREGLLEATGRGYVAPKDTRDAVADRLEVRRLLDVALVRRSAQDASADQFKALERALDRQAGAHAAGRYKAFIDANKAFRTLLNATCRNALLARCAAMVDEQFQMARNRIHRDPANRAFTLGHEERLLKALQARDSDGAAKAMAEFIDQLHARHQAEFKGA